MNSVWREYLQSQGAIFSTSNESIEHFGDPDSETRAARDGNFITGLPGTGVIHATGDDARSFLQGQLTNDIDRVSAQQSQISGYCSPKGRLLALFRITENEDGYSLHLPRALLDKTLARLRMFVLMAKVTLEDVTDQLVRIGVAGARGETRLQGLIDSLPQTPNGVVTTDRLSVIRLPGGLPRFEIIGEPAAVEALWQQLATDLTPVGSGEWQLFDIEAGIPSIVAETIEMFVPQMVNLDLIDGVSFKKGCYPGQEVVARLHYRGTPNRRMHLVELAATHCPAPGTPLYAVAQGGEGQAVGNIVVAQPCGTASCHALCVIINEYAVDNAACLQGDTKAVLKLLDLPGIDRDTNE